jgi:hypothetical protein
MATPQGWPNLRILPLRLFAVQMSIDLPHRADRVAGQEHLDLIFLVGGYAGTSNRLLKKSFCEAFGV